MYFAKCISQNVFFMRKKGEIIGNIFSLGDMADMASGCLRYIKDTSDLLCPRLISERDIKRRDYKKQYESVWNPQELEIKRSFIQNQNYTFILLIKFNIRFSKSTFMIDKVLC